MPTKTTAVKLPLIAEIKVRANRADTSGGLKAMAEQKLDGFREAAFGNELLHGITLYQPRLAVAFKPSDLPQGVEYEGPPYNDERASWITPALAVFAEQTGQTEDELECVVGDLLADLAHFCDRTGIDLQERLENAKSHYDAETRGKGKQFGEQVGPPQWTFEPEYISAERKGTTGKYLIYKDGKYAFTVDGIILASLPMALTEKE